MMDWIIKTANTNEGFIGLISLIITLATIVVGVVSGFLSWLWEKINPKPAIIAAAITGAQYPQQVKIELENFSEQKILIHKIELSILDIDQKFRINEGLPIILRQDKKQIEFSSDLTGTNNQHKELKLNITFGFLNKKEFTKNITWKLNNGKIETTKKICLPIRTKQCY